jgi:plastocyanin
MRQLVLVPVMLLAACGGDDGGTSPIDAKGIDAKVIDAPVVDAQIVDAPIDAAATVVAVTCPTDPVPPTITTGSNVFTPDNVTIAQDEIVKFVMPSIHNVVPDTTLPTDPGLRVDFNETKCLQFTALGTFNFKCQPHGFKGHVTVQ